jgi:predicted site-specific integrase-resolvase
MLGRADLEWRVDELASQHSGRAFADAIKELASGLNGDEKELLQQILLERGATFDQAVMDRVDARGWFERQWDKASGSGGDRDPGSTEKP